MLSRSVSSIGFFLLSLSHAVARRTSLTRVAIATDSGLAALILGPGSAATWLPFVVTLLGALSLAISKVRGRVAKMASGLSFFGGSIFSLDVLPRLFTTEKLIRNDIVERQGYTGFRPTTGLPIGWVHAGDHPAENHFPRGGIGYLTVDQLEQRPLAGFRAKVGSRRYGSQWRCQILPDDIKRAVSHRHRPGSSSRYPGVSRSCTSSWKRRG